MTRHSEPLETRFWSFIDKTGDCWIFTGNRPGGRYGHIKNHGKTLLAHRVSYEIHFGPIPEGQCVCHSCDNPPCVRPDHLFLGSISDNRMDMIDKKRWGLGSKHGRAKVTEEDARYIFQRMNDPDRKRGTMVELCRRFDLSTTSIQRIAQGKQFIYLDR